MSSDSDEPKEPKEPKAVMSKEERRKVMKIVFNKTSSSTGFATMLRLKKTFSSSLSEIKCCALPLRE